jgi:hypothetical protein
VGDIGIVEIAPGQQPGKGVEMFILHTWQVVAALVIAFLFGFGIGRTYGEGQAWDKMDREEERKQQEDREPGQLACTACWEPVYVRMARENGSVRFWYTCQICDFGENLVDVPQEVREYLEQREIENQREAEEIFKDEF